MSSLARPGSRSGSPRHAFRSTTPSSPCASCLASIRSISRARVALVAVVAPQSAEAALAALRPVAPQAALIGEFTEGAPQVILATAFGGLRALDELEDDPLPRIC